MRPVNLFLTEDGVLKLGYYGLTTQAECYSIKQEDCDGIHSFADEVLKGEYDMKSDVWSLGISLIELMGITPYVMYEGHCELMMFGSILPLSEYSDISAELIDFLKKCFEDVDERWSVSEFMNVSGMGWRMMGSIHL